MDSSLSYNFSFILISIGIICLMLCYLSYYLSKVIERNSSEVIFLDFYTKKETFLFAYDLLENLVDISILATEQLKAESIRKSVKENVVDKNNLYALSSQVYKKVLSNLSPDTKALLELEIIDFNNFLKNLIEARLLLLKKNL